MSNAIVINDVPELKDEKTIKYILKVVEPYENIIHVSRLSNPDIVSASQLRKEIKKCLEKDVERGKKTYDLIFLCESGGIILCGGFEDKLCEFGENIKNLEYSLHHRRWNYCDSIKHELEVLGEKPNLAIIEADAGEHYYTSQKLEAVIITINKIRPGARIHLIIGVAHSNSFKNLLFFYKNLNYPPLKRRGSN